MTELARLVRPAQPQVGISPSPKERHAEGIKYPIFRQLNKKARILLSPHYLSTDQNYAYRILVVSNKKGWFAAVQNSGVFGAVLSPLSDLRNSLREATRDNCSFTPQRTLSFSTSEPNVLALACNDSRLIVGFKSGQVIAYDTSSVFTSGFNEITPIHVFQSSQQPILDIAPNPNGEDVNLSNLLVVLRGDGTVQILNSSLEPQGGWATGDADSAPVAVAWSPKGKQLAIGLRFGDILTFTLDNKSSPQRHIPPTTQGLLTSLTWLAPGHTFRTTYAASQPVHHIIYSDKRTTPIIWTELEYSFRIPDRNRQNSYLAVLPKWDDEADDRMAILAGDVACTDFEIIGNIGNDWYQQSQENPLSIPLDKNGEDTVLLSLQVDLTDTDPNEGGYPIVYAYLNDGTLQGWFVDHPERKPYAGMFGATNSSANQVAPSPFSQPQQNSAFGSQPPPSSSFGQSSAFGSQQSGTSFGQAATPAFGQTGFGQASPQPAAFGSSTPSASGFAGFASSSAFGGGSFGTSASNNASSFGNTSTVASAPQITRDDSMSDSTAQSSFGGLSLGGGSDESSKPKSVFGGGGVFGSPTPLPLPPNHPSNQSISAFGSGSGSFIKPATGFGAFGNSGGSFGAFGTNTTTGAFSGGAFSAKPSQTSAFTSTDDQPKTGPAFGQSSFGQSSFGKPSFGQSSFGVKPAVTSGAFSAFAQSGPTSFASAAAPAAPASNGGGGGGGGGFASFAGTGQSGFNTSARTVFGASAMNADEDKGTSSGGSDSSGQTAPATDNKPALPFGSQSSTASGGAFSNFPASGSSVFGQPASGNGGASAGLKSGSHSVFGQPAPTGAGGAFGGFKTESPSVFGQASSTNAFGGPTKSESANSVFGKPTPSNSIGAVGGSKSGPHSVFGQSGSANTEGAFGAFKRSESANSVFGSPASSTPFGGALGATQSTTTSESDSTQHTNIIKSEPSSPNLPSSPESDAPTPKPSFSPTKGSAGSSGGAFGNLQTSTSAFKPATGFGAFGSAIPSSSPFLQTKTSSETPTVSAFGNLSAPKTAFPAAAPSPSSTGPTFGSTSKLGFGFALNKPASVTPPATSLSSASAAVKKERDDDVSAATPESQDEKGKGGKGNTVELSKDDEKERDGVLLAASEGKSIAVGLSKDESHESISSASSSFVEVNRPDEHEEDEEVEVPDSDGDSESNQHGDEDDFLSESYGSQSGDEDEESEEDVEHAADVQSEDAPPSPEPTEIPLPPSRSRSNTPQAETPQTDPSDPSSDDSDSSHLSTIREESTTPPGSPAKPQKPPVIIAPSPINLPSSLPSKHNTRPTRSSPLASKPLVGPDELEEEREAKATTLKPRPASPKTPFGVLPPKSRSTSPEDSKLPDNKRPKTPPLLSTFGPSSPSTPKPTATTLSSFATPSKPPLNQTTSLLNTPVTGLPPLPTPPPPSGNIFGKPFSLGPPTSGTEPASLKTGNVFSPPPSNLFGNAIPKPEARLGVQPSLTPSGSQPGMSPILPGAPKMVSPSPSPFSVTSTASPSSFGAASTMRPPPAIPSMEEGMQKECLVLVQAMHRELNNLREMAAMVAKRREELSQSAGGSRRKEDLCIREKWALSDSAQFGVVLRLFEQDISELKQVTEKQREELRDLGKSMIKAGTRREEIARFNKAKSDNEFSKMLKSRTLGPEHLENQTQLRRDIRALRSKVDQLEDQLRAHKKRLSEVSSGRPTLKPPSLDTINRTYRNIDIALQEQVEMVEQLNRRFLKLNLNASPRNFPAARDPRLPAFTSRSRPSIITPDVAVTTAAALNAERSAHKLKMMLLKARKEPLLNVKVNDGGRKVPTAYSTPKPSHGIAVMDPGVGLQFNTPIIQGPLFAAAAASLEPGSWDTMSFPEDNFRPSAPMSSAGRRGGTPQRKHGSAAPVKKSPALGSPDALKAPSPASFDWGPLPTFKPSQGLPLPGFDKVMSKSPSSSPEYKGKGKERAVESLSNSWVSEGF